MIVVVGSINVDLVVATERFPLPGETLKGSQFSIHLGGKGANQAVQAAATPDPSSSLVVSQSVALLAAVGIDAFGPLCLKHLQKCGVDTSAVLSRGPSTGVAQICLCEDTKENSIVIVAGANGLLQPSDVRTAFQNFSDTAKCRVVVTQNEILLETTIEALRCGKKCNAINIFSAAPVQPDFPQELFSLTDVLVCNEVELSQLCNADENEVEAETERVRRLREQHSYTGHIVVTLGSAGCCVSLGGSCELIRVAAPKVEAGRIQNTVGAGDTFVGALSVYLSACGGSEIEAGARYATKVASDYVTRSRGGALLVD